MTETPIAVPKFAARHIARLRCRHCNRPLLPINIIAAGVRRHEQGVAFAVTVCCKRCKKQTPLSMSWRPLDPFCWAAQVAAATPAPVARLPERHPNPLETLGVGDGPWVDNPPEDRPEYHAVPVVVLNYMPGNFDYEDGEQCSILTVARSDMSIEPLVFSTDDTKKLIARALVTLATYDDKLARKLLDNYFAADEDGHFCWPDSTEV